jgi:SpoVK/Ycf46/Vps4 family AAA+-type ATPase
MSDLVLDRSIKDNLKNSIVEIENENRLDIDPFEELEQTSCNAPNINKVKKLTNKLNNMRSNSEKLTLGFLLNLLDGVLEVPGRILIMTTNYPEKLDKALIRPGRIDLILDFKKTTRATIIEMYKHFYDLNDTSFNENEFEKIEDYQYSPAEINQVFFKYIRDPKKALESLL